MELEVMRENGHAIADPNFDGEYAMRHASTASPAAWVGSAAIETEPAVAKNTKVAIVGSWQRTLAATPCAENDWDIWTCSGAPHALARVTRHFELHELASHEEKWKRDGYWEMLGIMPRLLLSAPHAEFPNAELYPLASILAKFPRYFNSSVAFMLALAIDEGYQQIGLFGVNMETDDGTGNSEYAHQRPCCEFLLGIATAKGIRIVTPPECDILTAPRLYGYESNRGRAFEKLETREKDLKRELEVALKTAEAAEQRVFTLRGAISELHYLRRFT